MGLGDTGEISQFFLTVIFPFLEIADTDECAERNGGCHQICTNLPGSYECSCNSGYQKGEDSKRCEGM